MKRKEREDACTFFILYFHTVFSLKSGRQKKKEQCCVGTTQEQDEEIGENGK